MSTIVKNVNDAMLVNAPSQTPLIKLEGGGVVE